MTTDTETDLTDRRAKLLNIIRKARKRIQVASNQQSDVLMIRRGRGDLYEAEKELTEIDRELFPEE